jgi:hypothetical protein
MKSHYRKCGGAVQPDWQFCNNCGKKLPLKTNQKRLRVAAQLAEYQRRNWLWHFENADILSGVILSAIPNACPICCEDDGKFFDLRTPTPAPLPHPGCECEYGCGCTTIPIVEHL